MLSAGVASAEEQCSVLNWRGAFAEWRKVSEMLLAVTYRKECGVMGEADQTAVRSLYMAKGCGPDTALAQSLTRRLRAPLTADARHPGIALLRAEALVSYAQFCRMADTLPWPADATVLVAPPPQTDPDLQVFQAFWAHLDAMQGELTRMVTAATP